MTKFCERFSIESWYGSVIVCAYFSFLAIAERASDSNRHDVSNLDTGVIRKKNKHAKNYVKEKYSHAALRNDQDCVDDGVEQEYGRPLGVSKLHIPICGSPRDSTSVEQIFTVDLGHLGEQTPIEPHKHGGYDDRNEPDTTGE